VYGDKRATFTIVLAGSTQGRNLEAHPRKGRNLEAHPQKQTG